MKKILKVLIFLLMLPLNGLAQDEELVVEIRNIVYNYHTFDDGDELDCVGRFNIEIYSNYDVKYIQVVQSHIVPNPGHGLTYPYGQIFKDFEDVKDGIYKITTRESFYWRVFFEVRVITEIGRYVSPVYYVSSFISPEDLAALKGLTDDVKDIAAEETRYRVEGENLVVAPASQAHVTLCDIMGHKVYEGDIYGETYVPLSDAKGKMLILRIDEPDAQPLIEKIVVK